MDKLNRQDVFNKAYRGLRAQGFQRSVSSLGSCRYNGPGGMHCAVGWVWPIAASGEGYLACNLPIFDGLNQDDRTFVADLQICHDDSSFPMQSALTTFAARFELEIPPDDGQDPALEERCVDG